MGFCFVWERERERERERRLSEIEGFELSLLSCQSESSSMLMVWWTLLEDDGRTQQEPCLTFILLLYEKTYGTLFNRSKLKNYSLKRSNKLLFEILKDGFRGTR